MSTREGVNTFVATYVAGVPPPTAPSCWPSPASAEDCVRHQATTGNRMAREERIRACLCALITRYRSTLPEVCNRSHSERKRGGACSGRAGEVPIPFKFDRCDVIEGHLQPAERSGDGGLVGRRLQGAGGMGVLAG
jgi:hypothetical protein